MTAAPPRDLLSGFLDALAARLESPCGSASTSTSAAVGDFAAMLGALRSSLAAVRPGAPPALAPGGTRAKRVRGPLPVCRHWEAALAAGTGDAGDLARSLRPLRDSLAWTQTAGYVRRPPDPNFVESYGYAVIAGPASGAPALLASPDLAMGVLLLGPGTHYPLHAHPAAEIYFPLSGDAEWWMGEGPWRREPPGAVIHHAPHVPHATRAGAAPLLAVYLWRGDLATEARFVAKDAIYPRHGPS